MPLRDITSVRAEVAGYRAICLPLIEQCFLWSFNVRDMLGRGSNGVSSTVFPLPISRTDLPKRFDRPFFNLDGGK
jgi:hypothetical protein